MRGIEASEFLILMRIAYDLATTEGKPFAILVNGDGSGSILSVEGRRARPNAKVMGWVAADGLFTPEEVPA